MKQAMVRGVWSIGCLISMTAGLPAARAATYVVDQAATNAADTNAGTEAAPFATIAAAVAKVKPGDTVCVKNGTYRETVQRTDLPFEQPNERITLMAWPGHRPIMKGSAVVTNRFAPVRVALRKPVAQLAQEAGYDPDAWRKAIGVDGARAAQAAPAAGGEGLDHSKAEFVGIYACPWETYSSLVFVDEAPLKQVGLQGSPERAEKGGGFKLYKQWDGKDVSDLRPGTFFYDAAAKQLYVWPADGSDPNRHVIEAGARGAALVLHGTWTVSGFTICQYQDGWQTGGECAVAVAGHATVVEDCRILHNGFIGLIQHGWDGVMRGCEIAYNGLCGISPSLGWRMLIEGNDFHHNSSIGGVVCGHSGNKITSMKDTRILRNRFHDDENGIWCDINVNNTLIAENLFENVGCGIYFEISRWGVIVNNVFINCARGVWSYSADVLIAHNVLDGCPEAITITGYPRACSYRQSYYDNVDVPFEGCLMAVRNNLMMNNIIVDAPGSYLAAARDDAYGSANWSDYNVFAWTMPRIHWGSNHIKFMAGWDDYYGRLQFWRMDRHSDEHSVLADGLLYDAFRDGRAWPEVRAQDIVGAPGFVDRANGNYQLRPDSPLRGKGLTVPAVLNSTYLPAKFNEVNSRSWANTFLDAAPTNRKAERAISYGQKNYRLQPLPQIHRLVDLDTRGPADPGLNLEWMRTGQYPHFRSEGPAEMAPDDFWVLYPENRLTNPRFSEGVFTEFAIVSTNAASPTGAWAVVTGQVALASGEARAELSSSNRQCRVAQKAGTLRADTEYLLWADMKVESAGAGTTRGEIGFAVGPGLTPLKLTTVEAKDGQQRHWNTAEAYYKSGADAKADPHVGQDLYVVFGAQGTSGRVRWDNFILLTGEAPK